MKKTAGNGKKAGNRKIQERTQKISKEIINFFDVLNRSVWKWQNSSLN
jgi:hypothetical protein